MDKLIAVRVDDVGGSTMITGYVARRKNRKQVWTLDITGCTQQEARAKVIERERVRLKDSVLQGGLVE